MEENFEAEEELFEDVEFEEPSVEREQPSLEKLPIQLVVEVSRLKMTLEELIKLSPGSLLELPVAPEEGVDLVINGKKMGKGELVKMGDMMGLRITKL